MQRLKMWASRIRNGMESLFDPERPYFSAYIKLHNADKRIWTNGLDSKKNNQKQNHYTMLRTLDFTR